MLVVAITTYTNSYSQLSYFYLRAFVLQVQASIQLKLSWVLEQKRHMKVERNRLDICWKRLQEERKKFEDVSKMKEKELQVREAKLAQIKDLISAAAELKEIGFDFSLANSWLSCVKKMAQRKGLDVRSAAWKLAEDLKNWQELDGFETAIQNSKHQLELLNMT
jgi:hypothetical protein